MSARSHYLWATISLIGACTFAVLTAAAAGFGNWTLTAVFGAVTVVNGALVFYEMNAGERKERA